MFDAENKIFESAGFEIAKAIKNALGIYFTSLQQNAFVGAPPGSEWVFGFVDRHKYLSRDV